MRTIIAGSRTIHDYDLLKKTITDSCFPITEVFCGLAIGVDLLGLRWARDNKIPVRFFKPEWDKLGKPAAVIRDFEMCAFAEQVIGLDPSDSLVRYAKACQVRSYFVYPGKPPTLLDYGREQSNAGLETQSCDLLPTSSSPSASTHPSSPLDQTQSHQVSPQVRVG